MKWLLVVAGLSFVTLVYAAPTATTEIEALLSYVKRLDGAMFIRNGSEHTPVEAEAHLRLKWEKQKAQIRTAEDFIERAATKSSLSGEAYRIRLKDGTTRPAAEILRQQLAALRAVAAP